MLDIILQLKDRENSVNELRSSIRQGIPSAVFGVAEPFKNYLLSAIDDKVLYIVKER